MAEVLTPGNPEENEQTEVPEQESIDAEPRKKSELVHNIFDLTDEEKAVLGERVDKFNGTVRLVVHNLYWPTRQAWHNDDDGEPIQTDRVEASSKNREFFDSLLKTKPDQLPPIFAMEEYHVADFAKEIYSETLEETEGNEIYLVPTIHNSPVPLTTIPPDSLQGPAREEFMKEHSSWTALRDLLTEVGIKKIIISGGDLDVVPVDIVKMMEDEEGRWFSGYTAQRSDKGAKNLNYKLDHCAGAAAHMLSSYFDVEISNFTSPHSRPDIRKFEQGEPSTDDETKS